MINTNSIQSIDFIHNIFIRLNKLLNCNSKVVVAVSGGADSMFLIFLILEYWDKNGYDIQNLFIVHCNHGIRQESEMEQKFIEQKFVQTKVFVYKNSNSSNNSKKERDLRTWRYKQFNDVCQKVSADYLLLGHNLTDRIETSFLNLIRGSGLTGFISMKYLDEHHLLDKTRVVRPLLYLTKDEIFNYCKQFNIKYFHDNTNDQIEFSQRNNLRKEILSKIYNFGLDGNNNFLNSMKNLYNQIENIINIANLHNIGFMLQNIKVSKYRNAGFAYKLVLDNGLSNKNIDKNMISFLLKKLCLYGNMSSVFLEELTFFLNTKKSGYKYRQGVYFFISHNNIYIISAPKFFWQKHIKDIFVLDKKEWSYPSVGDTYGSKTWNKRCITNKVPIFWRNFIIVQKNGKNIQNIKLDI